MMNEIIAQKSTTEITKSNAKWNRNEAKIYEAIATLMKNNGGQLPSILEIANQSGLTKATIYSHYQTTDLKTLTTEYQVYVKQVVEAMAKKSIEDSDVSASKFFMQLLGWTEKTEQKIDAKIDQRIQISFVDESNKAQIISELPETEVIVEPTQDETNEE